MNYEMTKKLLSSKQVAKLVGSDTICTPFDLIDEILDKLPEEIWSNPDVKLLDPACGRGAFLVAAKYRFINAGLDEKHVVENMLYGNDLDPRDVDVARVAIDPENVYNVQNNITQGDSLKKEWNMKFDVVVGNPPYQSEVHNLRERLWMQFVDLAFQLCYTDGYVAMVTPASWSHEHDLFTKWFVNRMPIVVNIQECARHFPGVGSTFSYYVIQNCEHDPNAKTVVITPTRTASISWPQEPFGTDPLAGEIVYKMYNSPHSRINAFSVSSHHTSKNYGKYSAIKDSVFTVPVIKSISKSSVNYGYGKRIDESLNTPRVIAFTMTNGWVDGDPFRVVTDGQTTHSFVHMPTQNIAEAEILKQVLMSKLFKFVIKSTNSNRTVRARTVRALPAVDLSRSWTDQELYEHFNLTPEEIKLIEDTVK